jgi:tetratricopeptide (TPR) repeat protein
VIPTTGSRRCFRARLRPIRCSEPHAFREAGDAAFFLGDELRATRLYEESLAIATHAGARKEMADALINLGRAEEGLALYRDVGYERGVAATLHRLADLARDSGDFVRARALYAESIALWRQLGIAWSLSNVLHSLGDCALDEESLDEAVGAFKEALEIALEYRSEQSVAYCLAGFSAVAAARGREELAARLWGAVESIESAHDVELLKPERARYQRVVRPVLDSVHAALEEGRSLPSAAAVAEALESLD